MIYPMTLPIVKLNSEAIIPTRAHYDDAGLDLYAVENVILPALYVEKIGTDEYLSDAIVTKVRTGIAIELPHNAYGLIRDRSSMGAKGIIVTGGVIDSSYRGEIIVCLLNLSCMEHKIKQGDKIAQLIISPYIHMTSREVHKLTESKRGNKSFGSSGK